MKLKTIIPFFAIVCVLQIAAFAQTNEVLINQAKDAIDKADYVSAMNSLNIIFKRSPNNEAALTLRGRIYVRQDKYAEGLADVTKVLAKNPTNYEALNVRGVIKRERDKDFEGALADFTKAFEIKPDFYLAIINIGVTNRSLKKPNDAMKAFNKAVEIDPKNPLGYANRASTFIWIGKFKEAIPEYDKAISLNDKNDGYFSSRAYCHFRLYVDGSKPSLAIAKSDAEKSILLNPNNPLALGVRGIFRVEENNDVGANSDADKALQLNPNSFLSYMIRGFIKSGTKNADGTFDNDSALIEFEKALKLAPNDTWIKSKLEFAAKKGNSPLANTIRERLNSEALAKLEEAKRKIIANPWDWNAYIALDKAFDNAKADDKEFYRKLKAENPRNICAVLFSGTIDQFRPNEIISNYENQLTFFDGTNGKICAAKIATIISKQYASLNKFESAKTYLDKAKAIEPNLKLIDDADAYYKIRLADEQRAIINGSEETRVNGLKEYYKRAFEKLGNSVVKEGTAVNTSTRYYQLTVNADLEAGYVYHFVAICPEKTFVSGDGNEYEEYFQSGSFGKSSMPQKYRLATYFYTAAYHGKNSRGAFTFKPTREKVYWILFRSKRDSQATAERVDDEDLKKIQDTEREESGSYAVAGLTPEQIQKAAEMSKRWDAEEKKVNEATNALIPVWKRRLELEQSFSNLYKKVQSDSKNSLTYALQMKKDAEEIVRICEGFLSKYGNELGQTDLPYLNTKVDVINQQIRQMRSDIVANKKNIVHLEKLIKENSQP